MGQCIATTYRKKSFSEISSKSPDNFTITFKRTTAATATYPQLLPAHRRQTGREPLESSSQREAKRMFAEPTFIVSLSGLCGFILVVEDGEVDAYTPSGDLLGVFGDRIDAAEAVLRCGVHIGRLNH
jgi:hypothetical protein